MAIHTYDPKSYALNIGSISIQDGLATGSMFRIEPNAPRWTTGVDAMGNPYRMKSYDKTATLTLTVLKGSALNGELSALHKADVNTLGGLPSVPMMMVDVNSLGTAAFSSSSWIEQIPAYEGSTDVGTTVEWVIRLGSCEIAIAGIIVR